MKKIVKKRAEDILELIILIAGENEGIVTYKLLTHESKYTTHQTYDAVKYLEKRGKVIIQYGKEHKIMINEPQKHTVKNNPIYVSPMVYLAGKVAGAKHDLAAPFKSIINWQCSDGGNHSEHDFGFGYSSIDDRNREITHLVRELAIDVIKQCVAMVAYVDSIYCYGTIAEIAYASALNIPVYFIVKGATDEAWGDTNTMTDAYWFVSCFPNVRLFTINCECWALSTMSGIVMDILMVNDLHPPGEAWLNKEAIKEALYKMHLKGLGIKTG